MEEGIVDQENVEEAKEYPPHYVKCPYFDECGKKIDPVWEMKAYDGYNIWFDENGQFAHRHDFGFKTRKRGSTKKTKSRKRTKLPDSELADRLVDVLENPGDEDTAHAAQVALIRALTPIIEAGGGGATKAAEITGEIIGEMFKAVKPPDPGERCRLCGRLDKPPVVRVGKELVKSAWSNGTENT